MTLKALPQQMCGEALVGEALASISQWLAGPNLIEPEGSPTELIQ